MYNIISIKIINVMVLKITHSCSLKYTNVHIATGTCNSNFLRPGQAHNIYVTCV